MDPRNATDYARGSKLRHLNNTRLLTLNRVGHYAKRTRCDGGKATVYQAEAIAEAPRFYRNKEQPL